MSDTQKILEQANADFAAGNFGHAAVGFRAVIDMHPEVGELHINLGAALRAVGNVSEAEKAYREALRLLPKSPLAWFNLANLLRDQNRGDEALAAYRKADALQPGTAEILNNLGVQLYDKGAVEEALIHYDAALATKPGYSDALANRGNVLQRLGRMDEARTAIETALEHDPDNPVYRLNKSAFLAATGDHGESLNWADKAIAADPHYIKARLKRAGLLIQTGDLATGLREYEARFELANWHRLVDALPMPAWTGDGIHGKSLLLWNEQGFGDALMYARYLPDLLQRGARITVMVESALIRLFRESFGGISVYDLNDPPPEADLQASIMSLPHLMGTTLQTIPAKVPYLQAPSSDIDRWSSTIKETETDTRPKIGLIWAGNPGQSHDYTRSIPPDDVRPLLDRDDVRFVNLLVGPRGNEIRHENLIDVRKELTDFAATAALMQNLDLIISVDSAPAHLAGALSRPLWVLLSYDPDSRYFLKAATTPWYPGAKLFRQNAPGGWKEVLMRVNGDLDGFMRTKAKS